MWQIGKDTKESVVASFKLPNLAIRQKKKMIRTNQKRAPGQTGKTQDFQAI